MNLYSVNNTDGLVSAYQRINTTTDSITSIMDTGGLWQFEIRDIGWLITLPLYEQIFELKPIMKSRLDDELSKAYRAMANENSLLSEEFLKAAVEVWPLWEE
jgi:hypothetical protein